MNVNTFTYTLNEIQAVEKSLGIKLSELDKELLRTDMYSTPLDIPSPDGGSRTGKIHLGRKKDGGVSISYNFKKETLFVPEAIAGHHLNNEEKQRLMDGQLVQIKTNKNQNIYVQVDKELNAIIVKGDKELGIPRQIGDNQKYGFSGYILTDDDKNKLANGGKLPPKILCGDNGYFLASFSQTADKKGVVFWDCQSVPDGKVPEYLEKYNRTPPKGQGIDSQIMDKENNKVPETEKNAGTANNPEKEKQPEEKVHRDLDAEFSDALSRRDFKKLNDLANDGYKPSEQQIQHLSSINGLSENEKIAVEKIFNLQNPEKQIPVDKTKSPDKTEMALKAKENAPEKNREREKIGNIINQMFRDM